MKAFKTVLIACVILSLSSCGVTRKVHEFNYPEVKNSFIINESYDKVWSKVIDVFADNNIKIDIIEKESGIITSDRTQFPATYYINNELVDKNAHIAVQYVSGYKKDGTGLKTESSWNVRVKKVDENKTKVSINLSTPVVSAFLPTSYGRYGSSGYNWVPQNLQARSTGNFEKMIYERIK